MKTTMEQAKRFNKGKIRWSLVSFSALNIGEEFDKESGLHHIGHVMCNAMFYSHYYNEGYWDKVISENAIEKST